MRPKSFQSPTSMFIFLCVSPSIFRLFRRMNLFCFCISGLIQRPPRNNSFNYSQSVSPADDSNIDRPYVCEFCERGFKKSSHLKQHIRSHTGEKPYKCIQCSRAFVSNGVLKEHLRTHTGVKSFKCDICAMTFTTNGSLKRHMCTHSEARPFMCPYCQKTFKTSNNCKKHMKIHRLEMAVRAAQSSKDGNDGSLSTFFPHHYLLQDAPQLGCRKSLIIQRVNDNKGAFIIFS